MERKSINEEKARGVENPARKDTVAAAEIKLFSLFPGHLWHRRREGKANCISVFGLVQLESAPKKRPELNGGLQDMFPPPLTRRRSDAAIKNPPTSSTLTEINFGGVLDENCNKTRKSGQYGRLHSLFFRQGREEKKNKDGNKCSRLQNQCQGIAGWQWTALT